MLVRRRATGNLFIRFDESGLVDLMSELLFSVLVKYTELIILH